MRRLIPLLALSLGFITAKAQNPFAQYGYTPKVATLSQGEFNEFFDNDTIVQIGSVLFNTKSKQIVAFVKTDTVYSEATLKPDIVSRWLSPDPLAHKYLSWSPYNFVMGNPINLIDPDGRAVWKPGIGDDGQLTAVREKGDNAQTLQKFLGVSKERAEQLYDPNKSSIKLPDDIPGVRQINAAIQDNGTNMSYAFGDANYNCWRSATDISQGKQQDFKTPMEQADFKKEITGKYTDVTNTPGNYKFGSTVIRFGEMQLDIWSMSYKNATTHGAVYLGTGNDGSIYTWSKNGNFDKPGIFTTNQLSNDFGYGKIEGYGAAKGGGFYNLTNP